MRIATLFAGLMLLSAGTTLGQYTEFAWIPNQDSVLSDTPLGTDVFPPYAPGRQGGARGVAGPCDLDNDGKTDLLVTDYSGGGRVYMVEAVDADTWEVVYALPGLDSTSHSNNLRYAACGDLDSDGMGEIIALTGRGYSQYNPLAAILPPGLYVIESDGDNSFPLTPGTSYTFPDALPGRWVSEKITTMDVDGDGTEEVLFANNGANNDFDNWYVLSVTSVDILGVWNEEARWSSRAAQDFDPVNRGGGSPYSIIPADLDGDGTYELQLSSWNSLNFTNVDVTGANTYEAGASGDYPEWVHASDRDEVPLFGCLALDMDQNGDDEVYCPVYGSGNVTVVNYEDGEDVTKVDSSNVVYGILPGFSSLGLAAGDIDGDGLPELIGSGPSYSPGAYEAGDPPQWLRVADFRVGGDVENPADYSIRTIEFPGGGGGFYTVQDSAGTHLENDPTGPEFVAKIAYLGDADGDGHNEVAMSFQGVADSLYYIEETYPTDSTSVRTVVPDSTVAYGNRAFLRILSGDGLPMNFTEDRIVLPQDYILEPNYPNPFNPSTTFAFTLPIDKRISVLIYDVTGRLVRTLVNDETYVQGRHQVIWHGVNDARQPVASGQYFYVLRYGNFQQARPMILVK